MSSHFINIVFRDVLIRFASIDTSIQRRDLLESLYALELWKAEDSGGIRVERLVGCRTRSVFISRLSSEISYARRSLPSS